MPTIPVQPIPWKSAQQILSRMTGDEVPGAWQGGLPMRYRLTGGESLRVRLGVEQTRDIVETANVLGTLRGSEFPDEAVIIGCHHDAWGFGAGDPTAGLMCVVEAARVFGEMAKNGWRPKRSIIFAGWAAEEHGIVGSVEYVESRPEWLSENAVAYLNLDMAAMGTNFRSSASPSLQGVIAQVSRWVEQPGGSEGERVWHRWTGNSPSTFPLEQEPKVAHHSVPFGTIPQPKKPVFGTLGGGSDHVGFLCHTCIPSASLGGGGSRGVSYHSLYDNLNWYRAVVGDDYESARMVTRMTLLTAAMLAEEGNRSLHSVNYATAAKEALDRIEQFADEEDREYLRVLHRDLRISIDTFEDALNSFDTVAALPALLTVLDGNKADAQRLKDEHRTRVERVTNSEPAIRRSIERAWCDDRFDDGRPWYRNGFAAPDATSGYAAWVLPGLRAAWQADDPTQYARQSVEYMKWFVERADEIRAVVGDDSAED